MKQASRKEIHQRIFFFCLMGVSLLLPVSPKAVPPVIILMTLNWLIDAPFIRNFKLVFKEKERLSLFSFALLYFIYLICMSYSENLKYGLEDLEIKLSLLIFPFVLSTVDHDSISGKKLFMIVMIFVAGCFAGTVMLLGRSWYNSLMNSIEYSFYYRNLSWYFHPTYLSMYLSLSIAIIVNALFFTERRIKSVYRTVMIFLAYYFLMIIILLSSKAGIITFIFVMVCFSVIAIFLKQKIFKGVAILIISIVSVYLGIQIFPHSKDRLFQVNVNSFNQLQSKGSSVENEATRIHIWKAGLELISEHPVFGYGTGDVKDVLMLKYQQNNIKSAFDSALNAHNQYLQTFIATGITGFLTLFLMIFLPVISSFRKEQYLYLIFLLIFALNITFESMLEVQAGVVFYAFFNSFLCWTRRLDLKSNLTD